MSQFIIEDVYNNKMYYFTGVKSVNEQTNAVVTQYTTFTGTKISDNSYVNPKSLSFQMLTSGVAMVPQKEFDVETNSFKELSWLDVKKLLEMWLAQAIKLNITSYESYFENMYLTDIRASRESLYNWNPTLSFTEVRQASVSYIQLPFPVNNQEAADGNGDQDLGANNGVSIGDVGTVLGGTASGALLGAAIGSIIPGVGTAVGAGLGAVAGFFTSIFS